MLDAPRRRGCEETASAVVRMLATLEARLPLRGRGAAPRQIHAHAEPIAPPARTSPR